MVHLTARASDGQRQVGPDCERLAPLLAGDRRRARGRSGAPGPGILFPSRPAEQYRLVRAFAV